jgi:tRNA threonylcarbamoyladenosine biosynthesis protein TsaE
MVRHFDTPADLRLELGAPADTEALGAALAAELEPGAGVHLRGELGAGKTTLVRGLLGALGVAGRIKSPTFTVVEPYNASKFQVYHFDFYRFSNPADWSGAGFDEYFDGHAVTLVEWPEHAEGHLPPPDLSITLALADVGRVATLHAHSARAHRWLNALTDARRVSAASSARSAPPAAR